MLKLDLLLGRDRGAARSVARVSDCMVSGCSNRGVDGEGGGMEEGGI